MPLRRAALLCLASALVLMATPSARAQQADAGAPDDAQTPVPDASVTPDASAPAATPEPPARTVVVLIDAAPIGVDPAAATFVTATLRDALTQLGYAPVPTPTLYEAARSLRLRFPVPIDGMHDLQTALGAPVAVTAEVAAGGGMDYLATLRVRFAGESGERTRQILATRWTLGDTLRTTLSTLLTASSVATATYALPGTYDAATLPDMTNVRPPAAVRPLRIHGRGELALLAGPSFGPAGDPFVNFFAGLRGAIFPLDRLGIDLSVAYGNLRGRNDRVSNVLIMTGIETAIEIAPPRRRDGSSGVYLPIRGEVGYLPLNGPVFRATGGVAWSFSPAIRMEFDVLSLGAWVLPGTAAFSLDVGLQLMWDLGVEAPRRRRHRRHTPASDATSSDTAPATTPVRETP